MYPDSLDQEAFPADPVAARNQALFRLAENADYVSQRALQLDDQVQEAEQIVQQMQALARQLRTLASNTTLEATRMSMGGPLAEIARQMRRISQRMSEANEQLALTLRSHSVATGELQQASSSLVVDARSVRPESMAPDSTRPVGRFVTSTHVTPELGHGEESRVVGGSG